MALPCYGIVSAGSVFFVLEVAIEKVTVRLLWLIVPLPFLFRYLHTFYSVLTLSHTIRIGRVKFATPAAVGGIL